VAIIFSALHIFRVDKEACKMTCGEAEGFTLYSLTCCFGEQLMVELDSTRRYASIIVALQQLELAPIQRPRREPTPQSTLAASETALAKGAINSNNRYSGNYSKIITILDFFCEDSYYCKQ
jgi:hypothetical protein